MTVNDIQNKLATELFHYTTDKRKASGRALGTLLEIITYYLIKTWGHGDSIVIEKGIPEYGNSEITHNVEFSLNPIEMVKEISISKNDVMPITAKKIIKKLKEEHSIKIGQNPKNASLLTKNQILKNACLIDEFDSKFWIANLKNKDKIIISKLKEKPYMIFECKRVGVEEGMSKGPQTIEKAKQGSYVARSVSSLQKIRSETGELMGVISNNGEYQIKPFVDFLDEIISSENDELLKNLVVSVGVVSDHGNWFTDKILNKEMKVLQQSYDWLLFLTDKGLTKFINDLLITPQPEYEIVKKIFEKTYPSDKNYKFTKSQINYDAHIALCNYFEKNLEEIEKWFNIITLGGLTIDNLKDQIRILHGKDWGKIH